VAARTSSSVNVGSRSDICSLSLRILDSVATLASRELNEHSSESRSARAERRRQLRAIVNPRILPRTVLLRRVESLLTRSS
jgi:hypothetical protein